MTTPVSGTPDGPIRLRARLDVGWTRPERPIDLAAIELDALLVGAPDPGATRFALRLVGLDVGQGRQTVTLDPGGLADGAGQGGRAHRAAPVDQSG